MRMLMRSSEITEYLSKVFPEVEFYTGTIDRNKRCVGVYSRGSASPHISIGGIENSSYNVLPIVLLVHWSEDSDETENEAIYIYDVLCTLQDKKIIAKNINSFEQERVEWDKYNLTWTGKGLRRIIAFQMNNGGPINISRDENNICEMVINASIIYETEVSDYED